MANSQSYNMVVEDVSCQHFRQELRTQENGVQVNDNGGIESLHHYFGGSDAAFVASLAAENKQIAQGTDRRSDTNHNAPIMLKRAKEGDTTTVENARGPIPEDAIAASVDVLCDGREKNKMYHDLVYSHAQEYAASDACFKKSVAKKVLDAVHAKNGRFLEKNYKSDFWFEISDRKAIEKVQRALWKAAVRRRRNSSIDRRAEKGIPVESTATKRLLDVDHVNAPSNLLERAKEGDITTVENAQGGQTPIPDTAVRHTDVLCGASSYQSHQGNRVYRDLVHTHAHEYASTRGFKQLVAKKILDGVHAKNGRFLEKDYRSGSWFEVSNEAATKKAQQALWKATSSPTFDRRGIHYTAITHADVLFDGQHGPNSPFKYHSGNKRYQALVLRDVGEFALAETVTAKLDVAKKVVSLIHAGPGRFLKKDDGSGTWLVLDVQEAMKKVMEDLYRHVASRRITSHDSRGIHYGAITYADVLCDGEHVLNGRYSSHQGNIKYRDLILTHASEYASAKGVEMGVARQVVRAIYADHGRFLKKYDGSGTWWFDIGVQNALHKAIGDLYNASKTVFSGQLKSSPAFTAFGACNEKHIEQGIPVDATTEVDVLCESKQANDAKAGSKTYQQKVVSGRKKKHSGVPGHAILQTRSETAFVSPCVNSNSKACNASGEEISSGVPGDAIRQTPDERSEKAFVTHCNDSNVKPCHAKDKEKFGMKRKSGSSDKVAPIRQQKRGCVRGDPNLQTPSKTCENTLQSTPSFIDDLQPCNRSSTKNLGMKRKSRDSVDQTVDAKAPSAKNAPHGDTIFQFPIVNIADLEWPFVDGEPSSRELFEMKMNAVAQTNSLQRPVIEIGSLVPTTPRVVSAKKKAVERDTAKRGGTITPLSPPVKKKSPTASTPKKKEAREDEPFEWPTITWI